MPHRIGFDGPAFAPLPRRALAVVSSMRGLLVSALLVVGCEQAPLPAESLPTARRTAPARAATTVTVIGDEILVDGELAEKTTAILKNGYWALPKVEALVQDRQNRLLAESALCRWLPAELSTCSIAIRRVASSRVRIAATRDTPYIVVKKLLFTLNKLGFTRTHFLVADERGRIGQLDLAWAPCEEWEPIAGSCLTRCRRTGVP